MPNAAHPPKLSTRLALLALVALAALLIGAGSATAETKTLKNSSPITIPTSGQATPASSPLYVGGLRGPIVDIEVALKNVTHTHPGDLDVLLVAPDGTRVILMSDACGSTDVANHTWIFKSNDFLVPQMSEAGSCPGTYYVPTNYQFPDSWPASPGSSFDYLKSLHGKVPEGDWRLLVVDDSAGDYGTIADGWSLTFTTDSADLFIPDAGNYGLASRYPATRTVSGSNEVITDVDVSVPRFAHDRPDDVDMMLVGPRGEQVMLMSDACGTSVTETSFVFDDEARGALPDDADPATCQGRVKPSNYVDGDVMPAPAPTGLPGGRLDVFDYTEPNGEWRLYVSDDDYGASGYVVDPWDLVVQTRPKATVEFAEAAVQVPEGSERTVTIRRTGPAELGRGIVDVQSAPGSASVGSDFRPISTSVQFERGEREKTVSLNALTDGEVEGAETYTVALTAAIDDARLGTQTQVTATIPASAGSTGQGTGEGSGSDVPPARTCAGKAATIVGTGGRDVLRGTGRADVIVALGGHDLVRAARGNDIVCAAAGNDRLEGGAGRDRLYGQSGRDRLIGGAGDDRCSGGPGRNQVSC